jgi:AcrR family transcriptional regulator
VADENSDRDLFGQAVQQAAKGRGRPAHQRTRETVNRVILGFARGRSVKEVALSIGVSVPTLRQHYSSEVAARHATALMVESVQLGRLNDQAEKGNVAAEKELLKALAKGRLEATAERFQSTEPKPKKEKLGKKAQAKEDAKGQGGIFAPPPPPSLLDPQGNA